MNSALKKFLAAVLLALPATATTASTLLVVDARADPGIELLATFVPSILAQDGERLIGGHETVMTYAVIDLQNTLPILWMASVWRNGELVANDLSHPLTTPNENFSLTYSDELTITHSDDGWHVPTFDSNLYQIKIGFGVMSNYLSWVYSTPCHPDQVIRLAPSGYQIVRSDGRDQRGSPVPDLEAWTIPWGSRRELIFDSSGIGTLKPLP